MGQTQQMREIARLFSVVEGERRYFQDLAGNLPQALALFDRRSAMVWSNAAFARVCGTAQALADVLPTTALRMAAKKILEGGHDSYSEQTEAGEPTGEPNVESIKVLRYSLAPNDNWAAETELLVMVEDLTAAVEAARKEAEARFAPFEAITWELDSVRMEFLRVDQTAAEKLGFEGDLWMRGRSFWARRLSPDELAQLRSAYQVPAGERITCEYRATDRSGRLRWLRDRAQVREGRIIGVTEDVTDQMDRQQMAQRAARIGAQRTLASTVAHDNNNLLMILQGYGEDLLHGLPADSPLQANVREIVAATERLAAHSRTLAAYTAKQPNPAPETLVLDVYLNEHREALMAALAAGAELTLDPASAKARVRIDGLRMTECLRALIQSLRGPVRVATARAGESNVRLTISSTVGNTVPGNVFEVSANPAVPLGPELHAAYEFLRASGGDVVVHDTAYEILLPRLADAPAAQEKPKPVILVVDDEESIRTLVRKVLEREGYRVLEAGSGAAALQVSLDHKGPIGLLLSDVVMPGMSGVELAESLSLRRPEMRTLLISGHTGEASLSSAKLPHGFTFLQKPFSLPDLLGRVRVLLQEQA